MRAQIKIMTMVLVLAIFMTFAVIGIGIWSTQQAENIEQNIQEAEAQRAIHVTNIVLGMPEFRCSIENTWERNCVDVTRLTPLNPAEYQGLLGNSKVTVKIQGSGDVTVYANTRQGNKEQTITPVTIYHPRSQTYSQGVLVVEVFA